MTSSERRLWNVLRGPQSPFRFRRQHPIDPYVVDFYCPDRKLIIEVDGGGHGDEKDLQRDTYLERKGYRVLRFWNNDVNENLEGVWSCILKSINERNISPTPALPLEGGGGECGSAAESIHITRKRLIFRSWHRGTREMDIIMGRFAKAHVPHMTADQLAAYDRLLTCQDPDVYDWYIGKTPVPDSEKSDVVDMLLAFKVAVKE